ncbi:FecR protein [Pirellulimonas nuda]|uniref:FecR protein n=1 Tax=Pirellulimonas nuda TaxID=2528009 RepID=A0A518DBD6_9BACT|nr:hypothetical protein [Pirellulimonas nuda]QDU88797.1 FecR protein [Pirellulimonas nuda]
MTHPSQHQPLGSERLRRLLSSVCDRQSDAETLEQVEQLLSEDPSLIAEYADYVATMVLIEQQYGLTLFDADGRGAAADHRPATAEGSVVGEQSVRPRRQRGRTSSRLAGYLPWAAAASLLLAVGLGLTHWSPEPLARVVAASDARLAEGKKLNVGAGIGAEGLWLEQGSARLALRSGAMIAVDAPARLSVTGENAAELGVGAVSVHVPHSAHGFQLLSPAATIIDLGTGYRAVVSEGGGLSVQVTQGKVRVEPAQGPPLELRPGQFAALGAGAQPSPSKPSVSGQLRFLDEHVESLGYDAFIHDNVAYVFLESHAVRLPYELRLDVARPGRHVDLMSSNDKALEGDVVDCYLLHSAPRSARHDVSGTVRFNGRIVGLICEADRLNATNELLGARWTLSCRHPERGSESYPDPNADEVTISGDRRQLSVHFRTMSIDQIRVLVAP